MLGGNSTDVPGEEGDLSLRLTEVSHVDHSQTTPYHLPTLWLVLIFSLYYNRTVIMKYSTFLSSVSHSSDLSNLTGCGNPHIL